MTKTALINVFIVQICFYLFILILGKVGGRGGSWKSYDNNFTTRHLSVENRSWGGSFVSSYIIFAIGVVKNLHFHIAVLILKVYVLIPFLYDLFSIRRHYSR